MKDKNLQNDLIVRAESDLETDTVGAVVEPSLVVVRVSVSSRASAMDKLNVFGTYDGSRSALFRPNRWGWAAQINSGMIQLVATKSEWVREVPF